MAKNIYTIFIGLFLLTGLAEAQNILISDPSFDTLNPIDCNIYNNGSVQNFFDDGNSSGNYANNNSDTITICPDLSSGSKVTIAFAINTGFSWDVDSTDTLFVFDGPDVNAPLLGAHNNATDPNGFNHTASFFNNPTGCLTLVLKSDTANNGAGWAANVSCGNPPQPFEPHMVGYQNGPGNGDTLFPLDTGIVMVCPGDSVLFVGSANFPYSFENTGTGYSQNLGNVTYKWFFSNGDIITGDSIWFTPPSNAGYVVTLQVTDSFPNVEQLISTVRVAPRIDFSQTRAATDSICPGDSVQLIGGVNANDTVGVSPTVAITEVGGSFAGLTYLPDGSGVNYEAEIEITGFGLGQTLQSGMDIIKMAVTMEHSFLGDLEMLLKCPSGDTAVIFNSYGGGIGMIPGGFGGGGTFMGDAFDNNIGNPGVGWTYNFSDSIANWGTLGTELGNGNTLPTTISSGNAMNPNGVYLPEESFANLVGCPINGTWKLVIRDNLGVDDGYIFDWAIFFNPYINPNFESYTSQLVFSQWYDQFGNTLGNSGDTIVSAFQAANGWVPYTFQVEDDFGCQSDTTIEVYKVTKPEANTLDTSTCENKVDFVVTGADSVHWSIYEPVNANVNIVPLSADTLVRVATNEFGIFYLDIQMFAAHCPFNDTARIVYIQDAPQDLIQDTILCAPSYELGFDIQDSINLYTYQWAHTADTSDTVTIIETGTYYVTVSGCNVVEDSAFIDLREMPFIKGDYLVCDSSTRVAVDHLNLTHEWLLIENRLDGDSLSMYTTSKDSLHLSTSNRGEIDVAFFDSLCAAYDSITLRFEYLPEVEIFDSIICWGDVPLELTSKFYPANSVDLLWSNGDRTSNTFVSTDELVTLEVENVCGTAKDTLTPSFLDCDYEIPNVFTPNGDGTNDFFVIKNIKYYDYAIVYIYNRWGQKIYQQEGSYVSWDGRDSSGKLCSDGSYYYVIEIDGVKETGDLTLISDK